MGKEWSSLILGR